MPILVAILLLDFYRNGFVYSQTRQETRPMNFKTNGNLRIKKCFVLKVTDLFFIFFFLFKNKLLARSILRHHVWVAISTWRYTGVVTRVIHTQMALSFSLDRTSSCCLFSLRMRLFIAYFKLFFFIDKCLGRWLKC